VEGREFPPRLMSVTSLRLQMQATVINHTQPRAAAAHNVNEPSQTLFYSQRCSAGRVASAGSGPS